MYRILIVEDDADLAEITQIYFSKEGYLSDIAKTCQQAQSLLKEKEYDLILLDIILPDARGDTLCQQIRKSSSCPIIFISCLRGSGFQRWDCFVYGYVWIRVRVIPDAE